MDHEYAQGWMGPKGNKGCKVCGQARSAHEWKPLIEGVAIYESVMDKLRSRNKV